MKKYLSILILLISCNSMWSQIWQYPNLPYGFVGSNKGVTNMLKRGIESQLILVVRDNDTVHSEMNFYDSLGRQIKRIVKDDTIIYKYNLDGLIISKKSANGVESKILKYNEKHQLNKLIKVFNGDTIGKTSYKYSENFEFPVTITYENGNKEERSYYENDDVKDILFYTNSQLTDSSSYFYSEDTIHYCDCNKNTYTDKWSCEQVIGVYDNKQRLVKIITEIPEGQGLVVSTIEYVYDKEGKPIMISDSLSNGSYGKSINYYNKKGFLSKVDYYSEGKKIREMFFTNIEYK